MLLVGSLFDFIDFKWSFIRSSMINALAYNSVSLMSIVAIRKSSLFYNNYVMIGDLDHLSVLPLHGLLLDKGGFHGPFLGASCRREDCEKNTRGNFFP